MFYGFKKVGTMKISKVIIPAAGLGTRLLPVTKEQPKEMLPIFSNSDLTVKPILQVIFEQLYEFGIREFYFIVGRTKRAIEDHFTPDYQYLDKISSSNSSIKRNLKKYYQKLESSSLIWINQPSPKGFGHSVLIAKSAIGDNPFLVHAGDTVITSPNNRHLERLSSEFSDNERCRLLLKRIKDPRQFGVVETYKKNNKMFVKKLEEKPKKPKTNLAIMPLYRFDPIIFDALKKTKPDRKNEIQLTDGIKKIKDMGYDITASELRKDEVWIDVGSPQTYWDALNQTHKLQI